MNTGKKHIVIVGAGPGGLTAAMILAKRGFEVDVYEKEATVGGRNAEMKAGPYRFDIGPTFLMMKFILDEMFSEAGRKTEAYLKTTRLPMMYRLAFSDMSLDISDDREKTKAEIARAFPGQEAGLDRFFAIEAKRFAAIYPCLQKDYSSLFAYLNPTFLKALPYIPLGSSLFSYLGNYFAPERLRLSFTFQAKYLGMSPWECPGFFIMLPYIEHRFGVFHVEGGLSKISQAMADVAKEHGARIHLSAPVQEIMLANKKATGVVLSDGTEVLADSVVVNADFAHAMETLVSDGVLKKYNKEKLAQKEYSCSTYMLYLGLDTIPDLPHHTIFFADDYKKNVDDIFKRKTLSDDFSFYVRNASVLDKTLAPEGHSALYVLVPVPNQTSGIDWATQKSLMRAQVLKRLEGRAGIKNIEAHIKEEREITPAQWQSSGVYAGATFNLAHTLGQMLYLRPHNRFEELENLFLVGGGTHPGSGLPTIYESGRIAANLISRDHGVSFDAPKPLSQHEREV